MTITEQNTELVKAFIKIMASIGVSREATGLILAALQTVHQMDILVAWMEARPNATESEIIDQTLKITGRA